MWAQGMLESILYFMMNFKDGDGNYPLYDYIGNVRKQWRNKIWKILNLNMVV